MTSLSASEKHQLEAQTPEQRAKQFQHRIKQSQQVWTLVDDDGAMLLVTDEEDCLPVWPDEAFAQDWVNEDWAHCRPHAISLQEWNERWLPGLEDDELSIVVFPLPGESGLIYDPWELADKAA